ncbi:MAG: hypothetical protein HZY76_21635 [Anaerolineae bacterium]|nr:MAG: hypothetical protein HZY76_21635 [Anaerolineae bacterium]
MCRRLAVLARRAGLRFALLMLMLSLGIVGCSIGGAVSLLPQQRRPAPALTPPSVPPASCCRPSRRHRTYRRRPFPPIPAPTETPTITPTASPTPTATPVAMVTAQINVVVREGPGTDYPVIGRIQPSETYPIIGRSEAPIPTRVGTSSAASTGGAVGSKRPACSSAVTPAAPRCSRCPPPPPTAPWTPTWTPTTTPTPSPLFYRGIGPQFYATNNAYLKVWVKVEFANGDPMPGYQLMVYRREGVTSPGQHHCSGRPRQPVRRPVCGHQRLPQQRRQHPT